MLGISIYFQDYNKEYIQQALSCGVKYIFTSFMIMEEKLDDTMPLKVQEMLALTKEYGAEVVPDIAPNAFKRLDIEQWDYQKLKDMGFTSIRLDHRESASKMAELTQIFHIVMNASGMTPEYIRELKKENVDFNKLTAMHNFYPATGTGLDKQGLIIDNRILQKNGIKTLVFISGDKKRRGPIFDGLPSIEHQRYFSPLAASIELLKECYTDGILIGDSEATISSIKAIKSYMTDRSIILPIIQTDPQVTIDSAYLKYRYDAPKDILRYGSIDPVTQEGLRYIDTPQRHIGLIHRGSVTMLNNYFSRYSGEIRVYKYNAPADYRINIIGHIHPHYLDILDFLDRDDKVSLSIIGVITL